MRAAAVRALDVIKWLAIAVQTVYFLYAILSGALSGDLAGGLLRAVLSYVVLAVLFLPWAALRAVLDEGGIIIPPVEDYLPSRGQANAGEGQHR